MNHQKPLRIRCKFRTLFLWACCQSSTQISNHCPTFFNPHNLEHQPIWLHLQLWVFVQLLYWFFSLPISESNGSYKKFCLCTISLLIWKKKKVKGKRNKKVGRAVISLLSCVKAVYFWKFNVHIDFKNLNYI